MALPQPASRTTPARLPLWFLQVAVFIGVAQKLVFSLVVPPTADEAYYWLWGQHLQWSYLDHAPLVGWMSALAYHLAGWSPFALHLVPLSCFVLDGAIIYLAMSGSGPERQRDFWTALAVFTTSPLLMAISTLLYPDATLITATLATLLLFGRFIDWFWVRQRPHWTLFAGALTLGLALLSKYNGIILGAAFFALSLLEAKLRPLWRLPQFYIAIAISGLLLLPIVGWNAANDMASLRLHLVGRFGDEPGGFSLAGPERLLWQTALMFSPFMLWPLGRSLLARADGIAALNRWLFPIAALAFLALSSWLPASGQVAPHWLIPGLLGFVLLSPRCFGSRWLLGSQVVWGASVMTVLIAYFALAPLVTDALGLPDIEANRNFAQQQLAQQVGRAKWIYDADFVATKNYELSAKLAWGAGGDANLTSLGSQLDQFQFWHPAADLRGKTAIILNDDPSVPDNVAAHFSTVVPIGIARAQRFGRSLGEFPLFLGKNYR